MVGKKNLVLYRARDVTQRQVFSIGCVSHVANLYTVALVKCLCEPVDNVLVDIYFWFDKSSSRKEGYHEFQDFTNSLHEVITKQVSTRWLSLPESVDHILS